MAGFNPFDDDDTDSSEPTTFGGFDTKPEPEPVKQQEQKVVNNNQQPTTNNTAKKYHIVDMYWLINQKLFNKQQLDQNESQLLTIGYNADFSNLRFSLFEASGAAFTESSILKHEAKLITSINVFSEVAHKLYLDITKKGNNEKISIYNFERIFAAGTNDWKPSQAIFEVDPKSGTVILKVNYNNKIYLYTFMEYQITYLLNTLKFMIDGTAWSSSLNMTAFN